MSSQPPLNPSILGHLYDVAVDPASYERLLEYWNALIEPTLRGGELGSLGEESASKYVDHLRRADRVLAQVMDTPAVESAEAAVSQMRHFAAFAVNRDGRLLATNASSSLLLGVTVGARVRELPIESGDADRLLEACLSMLRGKGHDARALCLRSRGAGRLIVLHLHTVRLRTEERLVLCVTSEVVWPVGFEEEVRSSFSLSQAETEVLRHLTEGYCIADIAKLRARSPDTVRVQVKSLLTKTGARSQLELVRLAMSLVETRRSLPLTAVAGEVPLSPVPRRTVTLSDGRKLEYLVLGAPEGRPILFLPLDLGFTRWTASAEAEARRRKLRILVPIRPGYGESSPCPSDQDYLSQLIDDHLALLRHLSIERLPILTLGDDFLFAIQLHFAAPARFSALIGCGGVMPFTKPQQYQRMGKWHRFIVTSAKYTPQFLPFIVKAGAALARRYGKEKLLSAIYSVSEADAATFALPEVRDTLVQCTDVMLSDTHSAHEALAAELIAKSQANWTAPLQRLQADAERGAIDVHFCNGEQDPEVQLETLREFREQYPWIQFTVYPDAGQLVFYLKWRDILELAERYVV